MNSLLKKSVLVLISCILIGTNVYAEPAQTVSNTESSTIQTLQTNIEKLDSQIENLMKQIDDNNKQIADTETSIKSTEKELQNTESNIEAEKSLLNKRLKAMYINGFDGYLNVLLGSKNISDLLSNTDMIVKIMNFNENTIKKYKNDKELIVNKKQVLVSKDTTLCSLKADNEKKLEQLNKDKESQKELLSKAEGIGDIYCSTNQSSLTDAFKYLENIKSKASCQNTNFDIDSLIAYAASFLKTPYVWGGTSPNPGFDCSGFTQYVCAHFGIPIGRTTYDQIKDGKEVPKSSLKPGDLIFFGTTSDPHHVGMYIGFGAYIHAPHTGDVIKISPLMNRNDYLTARRVINK